MAKNRQEARQRRKLHIKKKFERTAYGKHRVYVYKSNKYMYAGVADDVNGKVLYYYRADKGVDNSMELGKKLGQLIKKNDDIEKLVFDRSGYKFHGNVKAVAEGIKAEGVEV